MNKWDQRFLDLAKHIADWSKDPSTKVGAVITRGKFIVSIGYNGPPIGVIDTHLTRDEKLARTIHAELNAILSAKQNISDCTIYISHVPCSACASVIVQAGIKKVVTFNPDADFLERWGKSFNAAESLFKESGVTVIFV